MEDNSGSSGRAPAPSGSRPGPGSKSGRGSKPAGGSISQQGAKPAASFDQRLERLEALVVELEAGGLGLEKAIERYKEGVLLLGGCRDLLAGYRRQVEELTRGAEQSLQPYPEDPDLDPS